MLPVLEGAKRAGHDPEALRDRPTLAPDLTFAVRVYSELIASASGAGVPFEALACYCREAGLPRSATWWLWDRVRAIEAARDERRNQPDT